MLLSPFSFLLGLAVRVGLGWLSWWAIIPHFEYLFRLTLRVFAPLGLCDDAVRGEARDEGL